MSDFLRELATVLLAVAAMLFALWRLLYEEPTILVGSWGKVEKLNEERTHDMPTVPGIRIRHTLPQVYGRDIEQLKVHLIYLHPDLGTREHFFDVTGHTSVEIVVPKAVEGVQSYSLTLIATDTSGNTATSETYVGVLRDETAPTIEGTFGDPTEVGAEDIEYEAPQEPQEPTPN